MKVCGIIAEYNPFHNGHAYQIRYAKEQLGADFIVVCMSGDFVQRGAPAILNKYERTRMAIEASADLVLEMPAANAVSSAEFFASGGVSLLDGLGVCDCLCFGFEGTSSDPGLFLQAAKILNEEPEEYKKVLKERMAEGASFPLARKEAVRAVVGKQMETDAQKGAGGEADADRRAVIAEPMVTERHIISAEQTVTAGHTVPDLLDTPNSQLGVEYCRRLLITGSRIVPCPVPRAGSGYHQTGLDPSGFSSATAIRESLKAGFLSAEAAAAMPSGSAALAADAARSGALVFPEDFDSMLFYQLLRENEQSIVRYVDITPELGRRILSLRNEFRGCESFAQLVKTRNYTLTRVQRALMHILLGITCTYHEAQYARILGLRGGTPLLSEIKKKSRIPLVSRPSDYSFLSEKAKEDYLVTVKAANLYEAARSLKTKQGFVNELTRGLVRN